MQGAPSRSHSKPILLLFGLGAALCCRRFSLSKLRFTQARSARKRLLGSGSKQHHQPADELDPGGAEPLGDLDEHPFALLSVRCRNANLHQLMRGQGAIDLLQHGFREPMSAQQDHRFEMMRLGLQAQPVVPGQRQFSHAQE